MNKGERAERKTGRSAPGHELLPMEVGEHKTRSGRRAVVVAMDEWYAQGFIEIVRRGRVYRKKKTWGRGTGRAVFGRRSTGFDLVSRTEPQICTTSPDWAELHKSFIEQWESAKE
jgi:hypothetical protein